MNVLKTTASILLALAVGSLFAGCISTKKGGDNSIPWSNPASWENQVPGMGNNMGR
jgi:hypothetical protein